MAFVKKLLKVCDLESSYRNCAAFQLHLFHPCYSSGSSRCFQSHAINICNTWRFCLACRVRAHPSGRCSPASGEGPMLTLHSQPVRRAFSSQNDLLYPDHLWQNRSARNSAAGVLIDSAISVCARQRTILASYMLVRHRLLSTFWR